MGALLGPVVTRTRLLVVATILLVAAVVVGLLATRDSGHDGVGGAVDLAEDGSRFESSAEAGNTFALMASVLMDDARACVADRSDEHPRCIALSEGAAYVQTVAVAAATCTGPGVFEMRTRTLEYLRAIEAMRDSRPPLPALPPRCS